MTAVFTPTDGQTYQRISSEMLKGERRQQLIEEWRRLPSLPPAEFST